MRIHFADVSSSTDSEGPVTKIRKEDMKGLLNEETLPLVQKAKSEKMLTSTPGKVLRPVLYFPISPIEAIGHKKEQIKPTKDVFKNLEGYFHIRKLPITD